MRMRPQQLEAPQRVYLEGNTMALERESKYVSIGNMPYVAPQSSNALSNFADSLNKDIQEIQREEDALELANIKAAQFNMATTLSNQFRGRPDAEQFSKELEKGFATINKKATNARVGRSAQASGVGIGSQFRNNMLNRQYDFMANNAVAEFADKQTEMIANFSKLEAGQKAQMLGDFHQALQEYGAGQVSRSMGKMTQLQVNEQIKTTKKNLDYLVLTDEYAKAYREQGPQAAMEMASAAIKKIEPAPNKQATVLRMIQSSISPEDFDANNREMVSLSMKIAGAKTDLNRRTLINTFAERYGEAQAEPIRKLYNNRLVGLDEKDQDIQISKSFSGMTNAKDVSETEANLLALYSTNKRMSTVVKAEAHRARTAIFTREMNYEIGQQRALEKTRVSNAQGDSASNLIARMKMGAIKLSDVSSTIDPVDLSQSDSAVGPGDPGYQGGQQYSTTAWNRIRTEKDKIRNAYIDIANWQKSGNPADADTMKNLDVVWKNSGGEQKWQDAMNEPDRETRLAKIGPILNGLSEHGVIPSKIIDDINTIPTNTAENVIKLYEVYSLINESEKGNFDFTSKVNDKTLHIMSVVHGQYDPNMLATEENAKQWAKTWEGIKQNIQNVRLGGTDVQDKIKIYMDDNPNEFGQIPFVQLFTDELKTMSEDSSLMGGLIRGIGSVTAAMSNDDPLFTNVTKDTVIGNHFSDWNLRGVENLNPIKIFDAVSRYTFGDNQGANMSPDLKDAGRRYMQGENLKNNGAFDGKSLMRSFIKRTGDKLTIDPSFRAQGAPVNAIDMVTFRGPSSTSDLSPVQTSISAIETAAALEKMMAEGMEGFVDGAFTQVSPMGEGFREGFFGWTRFIGEVILQNEKGVERSDGTIHWGKLFANNKLKWNSPKQIDGQTVYKLTYYDNQNKPYDLPSPNGGYHHAVNGFSMEQRTRNSLGPNPSKVLGDHFRNFGKYVTGQSND